MSLRYVASGFIKKFERQFDTHNRIEVSASALRHNLKFFRDKSGLAVIPVLKGNAYGHGIEAVARALQPEKLPYVAVDGYFEALAVRNVSKQPVLIMGAIKPSNFGIIDYDDFAFVVQDLETIQALARTGRRIKVHLEVNTGMNRYGTDPKDVAKLAKAILSSRDLILEGVMSHLADSDGDHPQTVQRAVGQFDAAVETVRRAGGNPSLLHVAQSAGSVVAKSKYANAIRLGIGLYGINPYPSSHRRHAQLDQLRPALRLISTITKVNRLQAGDKVSYNYTYTAGKNMRLGVLPLGYYEGLNRSLSNLGCVMLRGKELPIAGRICMNHTMVDVSGILARVGDEVTVISDNPADANSIDAIARSHGLFNYSLLTSLSQDIRRIMVE